MLKNPKSLIKYLFFIALPLFSSCGLFNTVNLSTRYSYPVETIYGRKYGPKTFPNSLGITVKSVEHPHFFRPWDYSFRLKPTLHLENYKLETNETKTNPTTGEQEKYSDLNILAGSAFANFESTGHTPIGAISLILGYGATTFRHHDNENIDSTHTKSSKKIELSYIGFFAKRWYFNLSTRILDSEFATASASIKIGYYFTDLNF